jgi:hypothetical protein
MVRIVLKRTLSESNKKVLELTNFKELWENIGSPLNVALWAVYHNGYDNRPTLDQIQSIKADKIFVIDQEGECIDWVYADERIYVWDSSFIDHPRFFPFFWWWQLVKDVERDQNALQLLTETPTYHFEGMLGQQKQTSDLIYNELKDDTRVLLNYFCKSGKWLPIGNPVVDNAFRNTSGELVEYNSEKQQANISTFIPAEIYNQSWFTIITESRPTDLFFTEKTAKPILAKRLFVFFGAQHSLSVLHKLGFKTFGNVIDESYDDIADNNKRWEMALEQIKYLLNQNPVKISEKIAQIVEHNHQVLLNLPTIDSIVAQMKDILYE